MELRFYLLNPQKITFFKLNLYYFFLKAEINAHPLKNSIPNFEKNFEKLGRIACVRFDNFLDAVALFTGEIKVSLLFFFFKN